MPSDFLVGGQVSGLGTVHPILTLSFLSTWILPPRVMSFCVFNVEEEVVVNRNGWTPKKKKNIFIYDICSHSSGKKFNTFKG